MDIYEISCDGCGSCSPFNRLSLYRKFLERPGLDASFTGYHYLLLCSDCSAAGPDMVGFELLPDSVMDDMLRGGSDDLS